MTRRTSRLVTLLGVLVALAGLVGFWLTRDVDRKVLSDDHRKLLGLQPNEFHASFVVAGRDIVYDDSPSVPIYRQDGTIKGWNFSGFRGTDGASTDTILYVDVHGDAISVIAVPRDLLVADQRRINTIYQRSGAEGLLKQVETVLGVPIDYYVIVKLDVFQNLVDALGGVEVDVPYNMDYDDNVGKLHIHFKAGPQQMDGKAASEFIRFRHSLRGDIDRLDNVKRLAYALLQRIKELNVRAVVKLPELVDTFFKDVETNASPALAREHGLRMNALELTTTATLPNVDSLVVRGAVEYDPATVNAFMAATFGGVAREFTTAPELTILITDHSGVPGALDWYQHNLVALGVPAANVIVRSGDVDATPTRLLATLDSWQDADYFASLLNVGKQQIDRFNTVQRRTVNLELVLGADAMARTALTTDHTVAQAGTAE